MPHNSHCTKPVGPSGNKMANFAGYRFYADKGGHASPYFQIQSHKLNLTNHNGHIDVSGSVRVVSHGYKTGATDPVGRAPKISYTLTFDDGHTEYLADMATLVFDGSTHHEIALSPTTISGDDVDDVVSVCWSVSNYRLVKEGSTQGLMADADDG